MVLVIVQENYGMGLSDNLKKIMLPLLGCALIASVMIKYTGLIDAMLIGIGMVLIAIGVIKGINKS